MARIAGVAPEQAGLFTRVVEPYQIAAHHPTIFRANLGMDRAQLKARTVDARLKALASLKTAMLIGCPF